MPSPKLAPINDGYIFNMVGDYGENFDGGYVWVPVKNPADIKLGYPIKAAELSYQIEVAIWKAGRGPHPDGNKKARETK